MSESAYAAAAPAAILGKAAAEPAADRPTPTAPRAGAETPARLLLLALLWLLAATAASLAVGFTVGFAAALHDGYAQRHGAPVWAIPLSVYGLLGLLATHVVLLRAAWRRGKTVGHGNVWRGLGATRLRQPGLLLGFGLAGMLTIWPWSLLRSHWMPPTHPSAVSQLMHQTGAIGPLLNGTALLCVALLGPLWEELFFRGWLWTGLRRHWQPFPVMLATALPWLLIHMTEGLLRPLYLVPAAVLLSLARHYCDSVRGSLLLHVANNTLAVLVLTVLLPQATHG